MMNLKKTLAVFIAGLFLFSGCSSTGGNQPIATQVNVNEIVDLTVQAAVSTLVSTQSQNTPIIPAESITETPAATQPSPSIPNASITITSVQESSPGKAIVYWDAVGEFPSGFKLVWTTEVRKPAFPEDSNTYTSDPYARSAMFSGTPGMVYLVRVCRFIGDTCDIYSNLGIFAFANTTSATTSPVTTKTVWPTFVSGGGGGSAGGKTNTPVPSVIIIKMSGGTAGKALIEWKTATNPSKGFKILYSKTNATPELGKDSYYVISDGAVRSAFVDGVSATKYYFRLCAYNGSTCEYSNVYTFTFPTFVPSPKPSPTVDTSVITITGISNLAAGTATINWTASGTFTNGFKILYSTTNATPTLGTAEMIYISDNAARTATVSGVPRSRYYYRICKYTGSACSVYSNVMEFTYADISEDPAIIFSTDGAFSEVGKVKLDWTLPAGNNAGGYLILQAYPDTPIFPESVKYTVSDPAARTYTLTGLTSGLTYNFRLCLYNGSICTAYSELAPNVLVP